MKIEKTLYFVHGNQNIFLTFALAKREVGSIVQWIEQISPKD